MVREGKPEGTAGHGDRERTCRSVTAAFKKAVFAVNFSVLILLDCLMAVLLPKGLLDGYVFTLPQNEAEWVVVDTPHAGEEEGGSSPPVSLEVTVPDSASWVAFCAGSPRPLQIEDDLSSHSPTMHLPSVTQELMLSPSVPELEVAVVHPEPVQQIQPRLVNYYPLWRSGGRGTRGAGYRGRPRSSQAPHFTTPLRGRASTSSAPRGKLNKDGRGETNGV